MRADARRHPRPEVAPRSTPASTGPRLTPRIVLLVALVVVLVAGATVGFAEWLRRSGPSGDVDDVDPAARSLASFDDQRLESLALAAAEQAARPEVAAALSEPKQAPGRASGAAVPQEPAEPPAGPSPLVQSLEDQLDRRQIELAVVLDTSGRVVASAGGPDAAVQALATSLASVQAGNQGAAGGTLVLGDGLYLAAARRVEQAFEPLGVVAVADLVNQSLALQAKTLARSEAAYVILGEGPAGPRLAAATLGRDGAEALVPKLSSEGLLAKAAQGVSRVGPAGVTLAGQRFEAEVEPLLDPAGRPVAAQVTLAAQGGASPTLGRIELVAVGAALAALLVGLVGAPLIGRAATSPVREVAEAAAVARGGDLAAAARHDVPAPLADFFRDLVEKRALEGVVAAAAGEAEAAGGVAERRPVVVLVVEMPRYGRTRGSDDPREVAERLGGDQLRVRRAVTARGGRVEAALGHRVLAGFWGERAAERALGAGAEVLRLLSEPANAFDEPVPPAVALAAGPVILAGDEGARTMTGLPVQQAESLLREASSGDLILAKGIAAELRERLEAGGLELTAQRGLLTPQPVYLLDAGRARRAAEALGTAERSPAGSELAALGPGAVLSDRFALGERLDGGEGRIVFRARDRETGAPVRLEAFQRSVLADPRALGELDGPVRAVTHLVHPALARVVELGLDGSVPFLASEWVEGPRLDRTLARRGALPPAAALRLARFLAAGLGAIHGARLAHGALRPEVVVLDPRGQARLTGLGVAALLPPPGTDPDADRLLGSPRYLAPERLAGGEASAAADVYAAGALLVEAFTGRPIYGPASGGASWEAMRERVAAGGPEPLDPTVLPEGLAEVLGRCLAREPEERYGSGEDLARALDPIRS